VILNFTIPILMIAGLNFVFVIQSIARVMSPLHERTTVNARTGKNEFVFVNLEAVYPDPDDPSTEMCLEELMAVSRGWAQKKWTPEKPNKRPKSRGMEIFVDNDENSNQSNMESNPIAEEKLVIPQDPIVPDENGVMTQSIMLDENGAIKNSGRDGRPKKKKTMEVNETQISKWLCFE